MMHTHQSSGQVSPLRRAFFLTMALPAIVGAAGCTSRAFHIRESYTFQAKQQASDVFVAVILPKSGPYQTVSHLQIRWNGTARIDDRGFMQVAMLSGKVEPGGLVQATFSYDVLIAHTADIEKTPLPAKYVQAEPNIESDHPELVKKARQLASSGNPARDARAIHAFVNGHLREPRRNEKMSPSALTAYQTGKGVCEQHAHLDVALCRAAGIPARAMEGLSMIRPFWNGTSWSGTWNHAGCAHGWAEFHTGAGWQAMGLTYGLLCYGQEDDMDRLNQEIHQHAESQGKVIGGMTNPLHFLASAASPGVTITPAAAASKLWLVP